MKKLLSDLVRVLSMQFIVLLLIIGLSVIGFSFRKDILISYHKWGEQAAYNSYKKRSKQTISGKEAQMYVEIAGKHQDALVELGYFVEQTFDTKFLTLNSPQIRKMLDELAGKQTRCSYYQNDDGTLHVTLTCQPKIMPMCMELFKKYDVPPDYPNQNK
jgi:hypothetical protein